MVDYSKFNKIVEELSDSDEEIPKVNVTRLAKPTTITISGKGSSKNEKQTSSLSNPIVPKPVGSLNTQYKKWDEWSKTQDEEDEEHPREYFEDVMRPSERSNMASTETFRPKDKSLNLQSWVKNGGENEAFLWSQTADDVTLRVKCEAQTKAKDVQVSLTKEGDLEIKVKNQVLFKGHLQYGVWDDDRTPFASEEEKFNKSMTWEMADITDFPTHRFIAITLVKRQPAEGVKLWWRRVFSGTNELEVDVDKVDGRDQSRSSQLQKAWKEAHEMFLANRQKEKQNSVT